MDGFGGREKMVERGREEREEEQREKEKKKEERRWADEKRHPKHGRKTPQKEEGRVSTLSTL